MLARKVFKDFPTVENEFREGSSNSGLRPLHVDEFKCAAAPKRKPSERARKA